MKESPQQLGARVAFSLGLHAIKVARNGKGPISKGWQEIRHASADEAAAHLKGHRGNVGATFPTGLVAVDLDRKNGKDGVARFQKLSDEKGVAIPNTVRARTASGGEHLLFRWPESVPVDNAVGALDGIDLKTAGGQIVVAPSTINDGTYEWVNAGDSIADLPDALARGLMAGESKKEDEQPRASGALITDGKHKTLLHVAGKLHRARLSEDELLAALRGVNQLFSPSYDEKEITRTVDWLSGKAEGPDAWPEPLPIKSEMPDAPVFDAMVLLPVALRRWVLDQSHRAAAPPDLFAAALIVMLGSLAAAKVAIRPKQNDDWTVVPNLWGMSVAHPGQKKSSSAEAAMGQIGRLEALEADRHAARMADYASDLMIHELNESGLRAAVKKGAARGGDKGAAQQLRDLAPPTEPIERRFRAGDITPEMLGVLLQHSPGLLIYLDELARLLATFDRQGYEAYRSFMLELWNGLYRDRVDRIGRGSLQIPRMCVALFGSIQPDVLEAYFAKTSKSLSSDGFLQRLQVAVFPEPVPYRNIDQRPDPEAQADLERVVDLLADYEPEAHGAEAAEHDKLPFFRFDEAAQEVRNDFAIDLHNERVAKEHNPLIQQHLLKSEKLFCALALVFHMVDGRKGPVRIDSALRAASWTQYLEGHARRIYALAETSQIKAANELGRKIAASEMDGFTARDLAHKNWAGIKQTADALGPLAVLVEHYWLTAVEEEPGPQGGARTVRYHVNPKIRKETP